ncbi:L-idonate 5-dehydrogenase [Labedella phragmitis]|uniref:L-idonate 5-dehydrogenase n=1 Tax=Labedella phragmitis TaxID=2498849 RepID=A0A3S5CDT2_9MICO|nr:L-idonate 5-dehydrogenase [Labedella phragmitis]RWZ49610.1 L-idonate 5-dehydrogenase [Labedella phragmitis]
MTSSTPSPTTPSPTTPSSATPDSTLAVVAHARDDVRVEEIPLREPRADEAVVRIAFGGVCGSDLHYWTHGAAGESILREPMILGHEVVGTVERAAVDGSGPAVGTPVTVHPATVVETGERYPTDRPNLSPGGTYLGSAARLPHTDGAFARRAVLPARMLRPLPAGLSLRDAVVAEPAAVAWHAVSRAGSVTGKRVAVIGAGPIGALIVAVVKRAGASEIVAVDMVQGPLERAVRLGATRTVLATDADAIAALDADVVFESSGSPRGLMSAVRAATRGGRVVMVGLLPSGEQPALLSLAITRELELVGSFRFSGEIDEVIEALADGSLDAAAVVTHEFPVEEAIAAFTMAKDSGASGKVVIAF